MVQKCKSHNRLFGKKKLMNQHSNFFSTHFKITLNSIEYQIMFSDEFRHFQIQGNSLQDFLSSFLNFIYPQCFCKSFILPDEQSPMLLKYIPYFLIQFPSLNSFATLKSLSYKQYFFSECNSDQLPTFFHSLLGGCNSKATANPPKSE